MGNVRPGTYSLRLAADPSPLVGTEGFSSGVYRLVVNGKTRIWGVNRDDDGQYTLYLSIPRGSPLFVQDDCGNLVANAMQRPTVFAIDGPEGGPNNIRVPGTNKVWTGPTPSVSGSNIILSDLIENPQVPETQKWYFVNPQELQK